MYKLVSKLTLALFLFQQVFSLCYYQFLLTCLRIFNTSTLILQKRHQTILQRRLPTLSADINPLVGIWHPTREKNIAATYRSRITKRHFVTGKNFRTRLIAPDAGSQAVEQQFFKTFPARNTKRIRELVDHGHTEKMEVRFRV